MIDQEVESSLAANDETVAGRTVSRRLVLLGTPLALAVLEILHPQPVGIDEHIEQAGRFLAFHVIQLPLIGLVALAVYLLTLGLEGRAASLSRWAAAVFAIFYGAYDTVAGIATGIALRRVGAPRGPLVLLVLAALFLMGGHPFPFGTLAFGCFFAGVAWLELAPRTSARGRARPTEQEGAL